MEFSKFKLLVFLDQVNTTNLILNNLLSTNKVIIRVEVEVEVGVGVGVG